MQANIDKGRLIAERVRHLREARHLEPGQLATYAGVSPAWVSRLEKGLIPSPSATMLSKIGKVLRVSVDDILRGTEPERSRTPQEIIRELESVTPILVPETSQPVSAGAGIEADAEMWPYMPKLSERNHRFIAVPVKGDCMEPAILEGHRVIVDLDAEPRPGDIVLAAQDGEYIIKHLERRNGDLYLVALRTRPPLKVNAGTRILGIVKSVSYMPRI